MPGRGSRVPSGPWGRLRPVEQDPLESMGLPSKGDMRLLDFKTQERYYTKIVERYMSFCSDAGERDELLRRFASLDLADLSQPPESTQPSSSSCAPAPPLPPTTSKTTPDNTKPLSDVLSALRKLREGIVASHRVDDFATQAYLFCVRLAILVQHPPTYHPAILHLLNTFHAVAQSLTSVEIAEVVSYLVLDAACRRDNLAEAYELRGKWRLREPKIDAALTALAHDNYVAFARVRASVDGHRAKLMAFAMPRVRLVALKCLGKSYFSVELPFLEFCTGEKWDTLQSRDGVGWELEDDRVVIRRVRGR